MGAVISSTDREDSGSWAASVRQAVAGQYERLTAPDLTPAALFDHRDELVRVVAGVFAVVERHAPEVDATCRECSRPADRVPWPCPTRVDVGVHLFSAAPPPLRAQAGRGAAL